MVIAIWTYYGHSIVSYIFVARMIALLHEEDDHNLLKIKKEQGTEDKLLNLKKHIL